MEERERERFRPNSVGQSIKREEKRREKIKNDSPNFNSTPFFIIGKNKRMNVGFYKTDKYSPLEYCLLKPRPCFVVLKSSSGVNVI